MNYNASVSDFFKSPQWKNNLLFGAVCVLIPMIGMLVLGGWHVTCLWARGSSEDPAKAPPFDFQFFVKYLERGLWPFLVSLVASLVLLPVMMVIMFSIFFLSGVFQPQQGQPPDGKFFILFSGFFIVQMFLQLVYQICITPLMIRATITQDFKSAFNFSFAKDFISRMWKEIVTSMIFMFGLSICMMIVTVVTCYIGLFFAMPLMIFSWHHLQKQLYQLYLTRGGNAIPLSEKLLDGPPPLLPSGL
jgi:hypothetical protein